MTLTWKNNLMNQGKYTDFSYNSTQIITGKDAKMALAGTSINMYESASNSLLANYTTNEYAYISTDIRGRNRDVTSKTPGCSQLSGAVSVAMPVKQTVGAAFFNNPTTGIQTAANTKTLEYSLKTNVLKINALSPGTISIFTIDGKTVFTAFTNQNEPKEFRLAKGMYLLRFISKNGINYTEKIMIR
jgi:hypothetical protein